MEILEQKNAITKISISVDGPNRRKDVTEGEKSLNWKTEQQKLTNLNKREREHAEKTKPKKTPLEPQEPMGL